MPEGSYRGTIKRVEGNNVWVTIPRFGSNSLWRTEGVPGVTLVVGDRVLCIFREGRQSELEIIRKTY